MVKGSSVTILHNSTELCCSQSYTVRSGAALAYENKKRQASHTWSVFVFFAKRFRQTSATLTSRTPPTTCISYFSSPNLSLQALDSFFPSHPRWMLSLRIPLALLKDLSRAVILLYSPHFTIPAITLLLTAPNLYCSRLDFGDLAYLSCEVRKFFRNIEKEFGVPEFAKLVITASNDLNEETLDALKKQTAVGEDGGDDAGWCGSQGFLERN
ncbi:hypothetical protein VIGAN_03170500 [Vigna angularis var. angularis]|uniref:nicotinate phosphoribosyltransferase n=1 Tax=Vigna angularis var. angularis TaxID=157739 RepID=A0A0S3RMJ5_PHAAN|nr:hypothetical protein VIGAN_03170500 [Vigna angularis var. angularis]